MGPPPTPTPATSIALRFPSFLTTPYVAGEGVAGEEDEDIAAVLSLDSFFKSRSKLPPAHEESPLAVVPACS
jgi:hypothetical protein